VVVLDELTDPHNGSAVLRSADAFGVQEIHVIPSQHGFLAAGRVAKGTDRWLDVIRHRDANAAADHLHERGFEIFVASAKGALTPEALCLRERVAVVFGNEHAGASPAMCAAADGTFAIPMVGFVESLNVSVAAAVTLHTISKSHRGNLDEARRTALLARYLMTSVKDAARILEERLRH
jgi:tRNA (guanosine-2'-O-)-methyltransferase